VASTLALPTRSEGVPRNIRVRRVLQTYSFGFGVLLTLVLLVVTLATEQGGFGLTQQLADVAPMAIAALASSVSIIGGGFDLSISPLIFFTNSVFVVWLAPHGLGGAISVPIILGLGLAVGALTGLLVVGLRVQAVAVTLAMYFALQGVDLLIAPNPVSMSSTGWLQHLASSIGPVPGGVGTIGVPLLIWFGLRFVPFRRLLYAVGSNDTTAFSSGVKVNAVRVASYAIGGLFAGIGGLALTALVSSANASQATEYTLVAIAAVVLGGTSLAGGRGGLLGALFGAFAIYLLQNLLATYQIDPAYLEIVYGGILIVAVVLGGVLSPVGSGGRRGHSAIWSRRHGGVHEQTLMADSQVLAEPDATGAVVSSTAVDESLATRVAARAPSLRTRLATLQTKYPIVQLLAVVALFIYGAISLPGLASWVAVRSILVLAALVGLASGGQTLLILMGGFDLGVSGFIVAGALIVTADAIDLHISFGEALLFAVIGAGILGGTAGYICHRFRINPLVVTLATGTIAAGIAEVINGGLADGNALPWMTTLAEPVTHTFGLPVPPAVAIWIAVLLIFAVFLHRTTVGRHIFATGANRRAADYALINTRRVWTATFAFSAIASVLVGVLIGGFAGTADSTLGDPYLFLSVVAVIVGGTIFGGPGDYTRTCVGALFLTLLTTVLVGHGASAAGEEIIYGVIILAAVAVYGRQRRLRDRL